MLDARVSFEIHPSTEITQQWLKTQKVIALCGASGISHREAELLTKWVENGGGLLATYDTGLYDERGVQRRDGGALKHLLGVKIEGEPLRSQPECFYRIKEAHTALGEYAAGTVVEGDGRLLPVALLPGATLLADCWNLGTREVRGPAIVANTYGNGRTIYINGSIEANYLYDRVVSNRRLLQSVIQYLSGGLAQPFQLEAPEGVYGVLRRSKQGDLVLWVLANVGFKDAAAGRMRQTYVPVNDIGVNVLVPQGRRVKEVRLVRAKRQIPFQEKSGYVLGQIPTLHIAEVVHIVLG